jgi:putative OPT family oligopeptide transporter
MSSEPPRAEAIKGAHQPYVPPDKVVREFTPKAVILGAILGILFALSSVYLGLKVGLTVSASIPIAVLAITVFRWLKLRATILENNIVQTTGSAGESIAAGVAFTLPSLLIMGFELELVRVLLVALLGGLIGVLMMIPLRQGLIVKEHGKLAYPEGTACADVLIVGEKGGTAASTVFTGFFIGIGYAFLNLITKLWSDTATFALEFGGKLKKAMVAFEVSPPMLGVGYIIGPKVGGNMLAGGMLAFVVLIPLIAQFGGPDVAGKSAYALRNDYILYIGAGAVATGGFIALARSIPTIINAFRRGLGNLKTEGGAPVKIPRTEQDLSMRVVLGGSAMLAIAIFAAPVLQIDVLTALLVILFGFFFVTVSSRITGEIGSSSNPISGMTIATLLLTCGLFVLLGRTGIGFKAMALTTAALVCVAASNGGTISQDLKTGFLVGATPRWQQIAILIGVVTSAIAIGFTLLLLDNSVTTYQAVDYPGFTLPKPVAGVHVESEYAEGPDGTKNYSIAWVQSDKVQTPSGTTIPKGKYLTDAHGALTHLVDPTAGTLDKLDAPVATTDSDTRPSADPPHKAPDGKEYPVVVLERELARPGGATLPPGTYLADTSGSLHYRVRPALIAVAYPGFRAPFAGVVQTSETNKAPDGKTYKAAFVQSDTLATAEGTLIPRGKYYVGDDGALTFFVHPGVVGSYPYKLEKTSGSFPKLYVGADKSVYKTGRAVGHDEGTAKAPGDEKDYRAIALDDTVGNLTKGRYLVDADNNVAYAVADGTHTPVKDTKIPGNLASAKDGTLHLGEGAVGTDEGSDLGIDRKPYRAVNLTDVVEGKRPGRYWVTPDDQVVYYSGIVKKYDAPKAQLFRLIIDGTLGGTLPWGLVLIGVFIAIMLELVRVSSLPFAVGLYLPISTSAAIFVGGGVRWLVDRKRKDESSSEAEFSPGMLMASGLIAGGAILGVIQAILFTLHDKEVINMASLDFSRFLPDALLVNDSWYPMFMFLLMAGALYWVGVKKKQ